ncbi:formyltransferase family protein [Singulisphaera sp. Ch08]|uniref:Formyltransferase family protein n=1 Tax=Singulisphaera sp. Ch08 TaxID=3120278 RepID=A0AAU7CET2_9BACT
MKTVLICHADDPIGRDALARWLASFSDLEGVVAIHEPAGRKWRRIRREVRRVGIIRFLDVLAFRLYYALWLRWQDQRWEAKRLSAIDAAYPAVTPATRALETSSPNSTEAEQFIRECLPDVIIARSKTLLATRIFTIPSKGTFVMHPGICPEYRNAHGCFWALASGDREHVGMTLLRIDRGVDTGPVYGYFHCDFNEITDSHVIIQNKVVLDNLDRLRDKLFEIAEGRASTLDTSGRTSTEWGQPWLTSYLAWKSRANQGG